jgi:tetratricopeptide (TPR) repeat protein
MDEKIEQKVTVSGQTKAGDITLIGKIVNVVRQPAVWQDAIWGFLSKNRGVLAVAIVLEVALAAIYLRFKDLYLIPVWHWGLVATLLLAAVWEWYLWGWLGHTRTRLVLTLLVTLSLGGLVGSLTRQAAFPEYFAPQVFGIAVAELGEGPGFQRTKKAREISAQVYEHLRQTIDREFVSGTRDPGGTVATTPELRRVELRKIGVMPDSQTAQAHGERIRADVVIWGQMLTSKGSGAVIHFRVLETPDRALNPEFPLVLPVTTMSTEIFASELDLESDPVKLKEVIAQQSTIISSFALGLAAYFDREFPQAIHHFETTAQVIEASPALEVSSNGKSLLYFYIGKVNHAMGRIETGQKWLRRAQEANPQEPVVPLSLALGHRSLGQRQESDANLDLAFDLVTTWLETHPDDNAATYDRGIIHQIRNQGEDAILDYEAVIERDPDYYIAYVNLGQVASALQRFEQAQNALRAAIALAGRTGTNPCWAHLNLALVYEDAEEPELARTEYRQAVALAPDVDWMYYCYARFLESRQEMDAARFNYQTMTEVSREKGWAYGKLADFLRRCGSLEEALANYKRALHDRPEDALLHTYLAETYFALGDVDNALQGFEEAIECDEGLYYVYASYAGVLFQSGDMERAAQMYEKSLELRPIDYAVLLNLGQTYENLGQYEKARDRYLQVLSLSDHFPEEATRAAHDRLQVLGVVIP